MNTKKKPEAVPLKKLLPALPPSGGKRKPCLGGCGRMVPSGLSACRKCRKTFRLKAAKIAKRTRKISRKAEA